MAAKRKLFLTHAGELAHLLMRATGHGGEVGRFVRSYAESRDRRPLLANPAQMREVESTLAREALLVMAAEVRRTLPRLFASMAQGSQDAAQTAFSKAFADEFLAALDRAMTSKTGEAPGDAETFRRDLEMYDRWTVRRPAEGAGSPHATESPFPDRCALLLDPSMMGEARRAAVQFEIELTATAKKLLERLGRQEALAAGTASRRSHKTSRRVRKPARREKAARGRKSRRRQKRRGRG